MGDDANLPLFKLLAREDGVLENVLSTEPIEFKLNSFLSKIGRSPVGQLAVTVSPESAVDAVYPCRTRPSPGRKRPGWAVIKSRRKRLALACMA